MPNEEHCKVINHIAFKVLSTVDIKGKSICSDEIINDTNDMNDCKIVYLPKESFGIIQNRTMVSPHDFKIVQMTEKKVATNYETNQCVKSKNRKRVVTKSKAWEMIEQNKFDIHNQFKYIEDKTKIKGMVSSELKKKISSYKSQDKRKNIYNDDEFIDFEFVIELFNDSKLKCYYCNNNVYVIYDNVRESKQWTIERIDNRLGHNKSNSVMSCLECNLKRRTMYHENYVMTKRLVLKKTND